MTNVVQPINPDQQQQVVATTYQFIDKAEHLFNQSFAEIPVVFDLKARAAGMFVVSGRGRKIQRKIRYNPWLFAKYYQENLSDTVPHEVAHYVVEQLYGRGLRNKTVRPHGAEWQRVMKDFGVEPRVTAAYDLTGIPCRQKTLIDYNCACRCHQLGVRRHNRVERGDARYQCKHCGELLVLR